MIRRGFWVLVGAAGGIMGYRRAAQVAERGWARETIRFTRDVREGMDLYLSRQGDTPRPTLGQGANASADIQLDTKREDH